jgi:hypothetical protein
MAELQAAKQKVKKSGVLSPGFGSRKARRNELVSRLKGRRNYAKPVKGGTKKKRKKMGGNLVSRRSATTLGGVSKHAAPIHPGTGTDQSVHASGHTTAGEANPTAVDIREANNLNDYLEGGDPAARNRWDKYDLAWKSLPDLPGDRTYWTRPHLIDDISKEVQRLNSRGQRYFGISEEDGLTLTQLNRTHSYTWIDGTVVPFQAIQITGQEPHVEGFDFLGKIEHLQNEDGSYTNILKTAPQFQDVEGAIPHKYRDAGPNCDICQRNIYRKETFLVRNQVTDEIVQAGRDDLQSYTGYSEADQFANFTSKWADLQSRLEAGPPRENMGGEGAPAWDGVTSLAVANRIVNEQGFVRSGEMGANKELMGPMLRRDRQTLEAIGEPTDHDFERAEKIHAWLSDLDDEQLNNDYLWNLKVAATNPYGVDSRQFGLIASAPTAYDREMGVIAERAKKMNLDAASDWVGEIKERRDFKGLTISRKSNFDSAYGTTWVYEFLDNDNNNLLWFASNPIMRKTPMEVASSVAANYPGQEFYEHVPVEVGDQIDLKATIKEHKTDTFNDRNRKQTVITRGKLIE